MVPAGARQRPPHHRRAEYGLRGRSRPCRDILGERRGVGRREDLGRRGIERLGGRVGNLGGRIDRSRLVRDNRRGRLGRDDGRRRGLRGTGLRCRLDRRGQTWEDVSGATGATIEGARRAATEKERGAEQGDVRVRPASPMPGPEGTPARVPGPSERGEGSPLSRLRRERGIGG